jgi:hypothetical protein
MFSSSPQCPDRLRGPHPASYPGATGRFSPEDEEARGAMLTTHLHLVSSIIMRGAKPPLSYTSSWSTKIYVSIAGLLADI